MKEIRHSSLPKLAQCPCFESQEGTSTAAARGTAMDLAFRTSLAQGSLSKEYADLPDEDKQAVEWACNEVIQLAGIGDTWPKGRDIIITDENLLKVKTPGLTHIGTEDCRIPSKHMTIDLKSGQLRSYYEQGAAYCLGNMEREFVEEWEFILLFCDQQEVVRHKFTHQQAKEVVEEVIAKATDPNKEPTKCQYCNWCALKNECPQVVQPTVEIRQIVTNFVQSLDNIKAEIAATPESLADFYKKCKIFQTEIIDWCKDEIKAKLDAHEEVPGFKVQSAKMADYYTSEQLATIFERCKLDTQSIINAMGGTLSAPKAQAVALQFGEDISDILPFEGKKISKLAEEKPKKVKAK